MSFQILKWLIWKKKNNKSNLIDLDQSKIKSFGFKWYENRLYKIKSSWVLKNNLMNRQGILVKMSKLIIVNDSLTEGERWMQSKQTLTFLLISCVQ